MHFSSLTTEIDAEMEEIAIILLLKTERLAFPTNMMWYFRDYKLFKLAVLLILV